jgi:hypothetical protein
MNEMSVKREQALQVISEIQASLPETLRGEFASHFAQLLNFRPLTELITGHSVDVLHTTLTSTLQHLSNSSELPLIQYGLWSPVTSICLKHTFQLIDNGSYGIGASVVTPRLTELSIANTSTTPVRQAPQAKPSVIKRPVPSPKPPTLRVGLKATAKGPKTPVGNKKKQTASVTPTPSTSRGSGNLPTQTPGDEVPHKVNPRPPVETYTFLETYSKANQIHLYHS